MIPWTCSGYLYDVLDVGVDSSPEEIRCKYRSLAMQYHPDKTGGATTEKFKEISEAYQVLSDTDQRILYNKIGRQGMKQFASLGVPDFMHSLALLQASLFLIGCLISTLAVAALLTCYKLDHPHFVLPWSLIFLPVWAASPLLVLIAGIILFIAAISADFKGVVGGLQILATAFVMIMTAVAIAGVVDTVWAVISWMLLKLFNTLHRLYQIRPSTYRRRVLSEMGYDGASSEFSTLNEDHEDSYLNNESHDENQGRPYSTRAYVLFVAMLLLDDVCTWAFLALVLIRAMQGPVKKLAQIGASMDVGVVGHTNAGHAWKDSAGTMTRKGKQHVLSFYLVMAPLMVLSAVQGTVDAVSACLATRPVPWNTNSRMPGQTGAIHEEGTADTAELQNIDDATTTLLSQVKRRSAGHPRDAGTHMGGANASSGSSIHYHSSHAGPDVTSAGAETASMSSRLLAGVNASVTQLSLFYMYYMWATREEYEYNNNTDVSHPSAIKATLPLLVFLAVIATLPFCLSWLIGRINSSTTMNTATRAGGSPGQGADPQENQDNNNSWQQTATPMQSHTPENGRHTRDNVPGYASTGQNEININTEID